MGKDVISDGRMSDSSFHLQRLHGKLGDLVYEMTKVHFCSFGPEQAWRPALNVYRCEHGMAVCADLAGVDKREIDLQVEPRRLLLRGRREAPEPESDTHKPVHVLAMEIDYGSFERELALPEEVDGDAVTAEQRNGLLWIYLPFRPHA